VIRPIFLAIDYDENGLAVFKTEQGLNDYADQDILPLVDEGRMDLFKVTEHDGELKIFSAVLTTEEDEEGETTYSIVRWQERK
jgi:hypothetical protein